MNRSVFPSWRLGRLLGYALAAWLLITPVALAQLQAFGNVYGTVVDNQGNPLPGVTVTLSGVGAPKVVITNTGGDFRFLNLDPGRYTLNAELSGFGSVSRTNIDVNVGRSSTIDVVLSPAVTQTITVTAETPLLDVRRTGTGATLDKMALQEIPTSRDPWTVLQQVPGVLVDRLNIGGNESGQQSTYTGKGTTSSQATWNLDGVNITDTAATGASPTYYDFDAFEEMQVTTGGSDPRVGSPGVNLNMVTKRGTNELRGSGRFFLTDRDWQADPEIPAEAQSYLSQVNEISHIEDMGFEAGGPIIRDRLWVWGGYAEQNIEILAAAGLPALFHDDTFLKNVNFKLNAQILTNNSATGSYFEGSKQKFGRNVGPTRPPETAWNQGELNKGAIIDGSPFWRIEDTHIFSPNFYLTGLYSESDMSFFLSPVGGLSAEVWLDESGVWHESFVDYGSERPSTSWRADGSAFFDTGALNHELKFGFGYRDTPTESFSVWPGRLSWGFVFDEANNFGLAYLTRPGLASYGTEYNDIYVGDTMLWGNLTLQAGVRYQKDAGANFASSVPANPIVPDLLPAVSFGGDDQELEWTSVSPRIGATYALGSNRRSLIRAAYNRYAGGMSSGDVASAHPFVYTQAISYYWEDSNGNRLIERSEVLFDEGIYGFYGLDPDNTGAPFSPTRVDYDSNPPTTDELILGFEHELLPEFTVGVNFTHREMDDFIFSMAEKTRGSGDFYTAADWALVGNVEGTLPSGEAYSVPFYGLGPGVPTPAFFVITNRPGYSREYQGIELLATKRLANRWMLRGNVSWSDWTQNVENPWGTNGDPTQILSSYGCSICDGATVFQAVGTGSGAKGAVYINSSWSYNITGLVQLPWDINFSASVLGREGYPIPYYHRTNAGDGLGSKFVLIDSDTVTFRNDDVFNLDLRLSKEFRIANRVGLNLSVDAFNVTDDRTVLQRENKLFQTRTSPFTAANRIREMQSPQVLRFGARITF